MANSREDMKLISNNRYDKSVGTNQNVSRQSPEC